MQRFRVVIVSTPVGPVGSGVGGGVELTLHSLVRGLSDLGHSVEIVAPAGSVHLGARVHQIEGALQPSSQLADRAAPVELPTGSVLTAMWERVADLQDDIDIVVNLGYDWLPLYLTSFLAVPVVHIISMGSLNDAMDAAIHHLAQRFPDRLGAHSQAQALTFDRMVDGAIETVSFRIVGGGVMTDRYDVCLTPDTNPAYLGAVGRVSPEKGLEDVAELSARSRWPVKVWGMMQDPGYWQQICDEHPDARLEYCGFLATDDLQAAIGRCTAVVMTPKWDEAFGNVAIEAMATGVPVIAYDRGGPAEIIIDGETGFIVPVDDVDALVAAVERIATIDRMTCRQRVEEHFSTDALAQRVDAWLHEVVAAASLPPAHRH
ncbi:MAG TPA: glycosyltransferase [Ilumatobacteraceae bacterium]|nr:glycosyltransferase [Ilumatobacteraceae bacterium]